eukprot:5709273-Ditylum_brightwellii.AAC.1
MNHIKTTHIMSNIKIQNSHQITITECNSLFKLLDLDPDDNNGRKDVDTDAIIQEVHQNPKKSQEATRERDDEGQSHVQLVFANDACQHVEKIDTLRDVVTLLLDKYQEATRGRDNNIKTTLHLACENGPAFEVVCLLLSSWSDDVRTTTVNGSTHLHDA